MERLRISKKCYSQLKLIYTKLALKTKLTSLSHLSYKNSKLVIGGTDANNVICCIEETSNNFGCLAYPGITETEEGTAIYNILEQGYSPDVLIKVSPVFEAVHNPKYKLPPETIRAYESQFYNFPRVYYSQSQVASFDGKKLLQHKIDDHPIHEPKRIMNEVKII